MEQYRLFLKRVQDRLNAGRRPRLIEEIKALRALPDGRLDSVKRGRGKHRVDYRHIIDWLVRKPGSFENYRYKEDLFPTSRFRMAYDALRQSAPQSGNRQYLAILYLAATEGESRVDTALRILLERTEEVTANGVAGMLHNTESLPSATAMNIAEVSLASFDELFGAATEVVQ